MICLSAPFLPTLALVPRVAPGHPQGEQEHTQEVGAWWNMQELSLKWAFSSLP